jgi:hypothetical protein
MAGQNTTNAGAWMRLLSFQHLPVWKKSLIAPLVVLLAMFTMTGASFIEIAEQEAQIKKLDLIAFEGARRAMAATEAVADLQTDLYHLTSTGANETDGVKVEEAAHRILAKLDPIVPQIALTPAYQHHSRDFCRLRLGCPADDRLRPAGPGLWRYDDGLCRGLLSAPSYIAGDVL